MPDELIIALSIVGGILVLSAVCVVLLFTVPASATVSYHTELALTVRIFGIPFRILPWKKRKKPKRYNPRHYTLKKIRQREEREERKRQKRAEAKARKKQQKKQKKQESKTKKGQKAPAEKQDFSGLIDLIPIIGQVAKLFCSRFFKRLQIRVMKLHIHVTAEDAATTALEYVAIRQSIELLMAGLQKFCRLQDLRKADIDIVPDYTAETFNADICVTFKMSLGNVVEAFFKAVVMFLTLWVKSQAEADSKPPRLSRILGIPTPPLPPQPVPPPVPDIPIPEAPPCPARPYVPTAPLPPDIPVPEAPPCPTHPVAPSAPPVPDIPVPPEIPAVPDVPAVPKAPVPEAPPSPFGSSNTKSVPPSEHAPLDNE